MRVAQPRENDVMVSSKFSECSALNGAGDDETAPPPPPVSPPTSSEGNTATINLSAVTESTIGAASAAAASDSMNKVYTTLESVQVSHNPRALLLPTRRYGQPYPCLIPEMI